MARRKLLAGVALIVAVPIVAASSCERRGTRDAPINARLQDNQAPYIVNEPDGFMNLALKCLGGDLIIAHTRQGPPVVLEDNELCAEGAANGIPRVSP